MRTDRQQVRRDAERLARGWTSQPLPTEKIDAAGIRLVALDYLALIAELEQAERERDEWMTPFDGSGVEWHVSLPSPYTYQASDFSKLLAAVHEYESRVLAVEQREAALVEALREIANNRVPPTKGGGAHAFIACARAALAAHEQAGT